jgi:hypothetical protein
MSNSSAKGQKVYILIVASNPSRRSHTFHDGDTGSTLVPDAIKTQSFGVVVCGLRNIASSAESL